MKQFLNDAAVAQVLSAAGSLLKMRVACRQYTPVFALLTDMAEFRFYIVDIDGVVYSNGPGIECDFRNLADPMQDAKSREILRWLMFFIAEAKKTTRERDYLGQRDET